MAPSFLAHLQVYVVINRTDRTRLGNPKNHLFHQNIHRPRNLASRAWDVRRWEFVDISLKILSDHAPQKVRLTFSDLGRRGGGD